MFDKLSNGIPLPEAAAYFLRLRTFEKTADENNVGTSQYSDPDETGELEGQFAAPVAQVLAHMATMVQNELKTQYAYMVYANSLRDLAHHSIAEEFEEHADQETEHADFLLRRMGVIGGPIQVPDIPAPPAASDVESIVKTMIRMEQEGIQHWRTLRQMIGDENPMRAKVDGFLTREQEHLDELWQLVQHESNPEVLMQTPPPAGASQTPQSAEEPQTPPSAPETSQTVSSQKAASARMAAAVKKIKEKCSDGMSLPETAMGKQQMPTPMPALSGAAAGKVAAAFKLALDEMMGAQTEGLPPADPQMDPAAASFLQQEQQGMAAERANEESFYKQRFQAAAQQLQALQQSSQQLEQQVAQQNDVQTQAMQQAKMIQDAAMANSQAAHQAATQAMQQSLAAQSDSIQQAQLAVGMRDHVHNMRQSLLQMIQQELPPATPAEAGAMQMDQGAMMSAEQPGGDMNAQAAAGQDNSQQPDAQGGAQAQAEGNAPGQPGAQPDAGTPPGSATPGATGPGTSPAPAGVKLTVNTGAAPTSQQDQKDQPKTASDRLIGAIMGGALGAGGTLAESKMSNDPLRSKVKHLQSREDSGEGGFMNAMNLAQAKARLAVGEFTENHPAAATAIGAGLGAMTGAGAAPHARELFGG